MDVDPHWYRGFFGEDWLEAIALRIPEERTRQEVDFVVSALGLAEGDHVLDVPCGYGRHSLELARRGFRVTGVDLSPPYVERARSSAREAGLKVGFASGDMREIGFDAEFMAVLNLWTAFGYLESEEEDLRALESMARALEHGGAWLADTVNVLWLLRNFEERGWSGLEDGTLLLEQRSYDPRSGRNQVVLTIVRHDGARLELRHAIRLYTLPELETLVRRAGLEVDGVWGDFGGGEYGFDSPRLIVRARKPGY